MHFWKAVPILVAFMLFGCSAPVTFTRLTDDAYPSGSKDRIEVFIGEQPAREYTRIALIRTNLRSGNFAANIDLIKRQAAELGADGVILLSAQQSSLGIVPLSGMDPSAMIPRLDRDTGFSYSAYAIKYDRQE